MNIRHNMFRNVLLLLLLLSTNVSVFWATPTYRINTRHSSERKDTDDDEEYRRQENGEQVAAHYGNQTQFSADILHRIIVGRTGLSIRKATDTKQSQLYDIITRNKRSKKTHTSERSWNNILSDPGEDWENENQWENAKIVETEDELLNRDKDAQRSLKESLSRDIRASTKATTRKPNIKNNILQTVISHEKDANSSGPIQAVIDEDIEKDAVAEASVKSLLGNDKKDGNENVGDGDKSINDNIKKAAEISKALQTINSLRKIPAIDISHKKSFGLTEAMSGTSVAPIKAATPILVTVKIPANAHNQARENKLKAERFFLKNLLKNTAKMKKCKSVKITNMQPNVYLTYRIHHIRTIPNLELDGGYTMSNLKSLDMNTSNTKMALEIVLRRTYKLKAIYIGPIKDFIGFQKKGSVTKAKLQIQRTKTDEWKSVIDVNGVERVYDVNNGVISLGKPLPLVAIRIYPQEWIRQPTFYKPIFVICV